MSVGDTDIKPDPWQMQTERRTSWWTVNVETLQSDLNNTGNILQPRRGRESEQTRPGEEILLGGTASAALAGLLPELALHHKTNDQNP